MNPCPGGYHGDPIKPCVCTPSTVTKYQNRLSGRLLDRVNIRVGVPRVGHEEPSDDLLGEALQHRPKMI